MPGWTCWAPIWSLQSVVSPTHSPRSSGVHSFMLWAAASSLHVHRAEESCLTHGRLAQDFLFFAPVQSEHREAASSELRARLWRSSRTRRVRGRGWKGRGGGGGSNQGRITKVYRPQRWLLHKVKEQNRGAELTVRSRWSASPAAEGKAKLRERAYTSLRQQNALV